MARKDQIRATKRLIVTERMATVARLFMEGMTQKKIAEQLKVHHTTVFYDLKRLEQIWLADALTNQDHRIARELARLNRIEHVAWAAWRESKTKTPPGDPRFLDRASWCVEQRLKLFGCYALPRPQRFGPRVPVHGGHIELHMESLPSPPALIRALQALEIEGLIQITEKGADMIRAELDHIGLAITDQGEYVESEKAAMSQEATIEAEATQAALNEFP